MKFIFIVWLLIFSFRGTVSGQEKPEIGLKGDTILYEKLYLHVDRELYSPGDDIWFKTYLVSGINHRPIQGFKNVYVQLVDRNGEIMDQRMILSIDGIANNDFQLPYNLPNGQYTLRGYTKYLENFGEEGMFHQKIVVAGASNRPQPKINAEEGQLSDISFLPEGGNLIANAANYIAFRAIDKKGKGVPVSGKIVDEAGGEVVTFKSRYRGMGVFMMMPEEGRQYKAIVDNFPDFEHTFEEPQPDGIALHYFEEGNYLKFTLSRNFKSTGAKKLVLTGSHKGTELFAEEFEMTGFQHLVEIYRGFFPLGISKISLSDNFGNIIAERLVFLQNLDRKTLHITSDKPAHNAREKVEINLELLLRQNDDSIVTGFSVAVVNEAYLGDGGRALSMESYLLLDSELKGPVESPASCFIDEEGISAHEKLDMVMMVNGWRRYYWDGVGQIFSKLLSGWADTGLTIGGEVKPMWGNKTVKGGIVELGPFSSQFIILKDTLDNSGKFSFNRLFFKDSAKVMLNAKNQRGNNINAKISLIPPLPVFNKTLPSGRAEEVNLATKEIAIPEKFEITNHYRYLAELPFKPEMGSILLTDVNIVRDITSNPIITGAYGALDRSFELTDNERKLFPDLLKYLEFVIPILTVSPDDSIRFGNSKTPANIYIDGYAPYSSLDLITLDDILKIEVIDPKWEQMEEHEMPGVISILTKTGYGKFNNEFVRNIDGRATPIVRGFRQAREFYSPAYSIEGTNSEGLPDQRPTLFWAPYILPENGIATVNFHTSDMPGNYRIIVEGISSKGRIITGSAVINVREE